MKRFTLISLSALLTLLMQSCLVVSLHPLASEETQIFDPGLVGQWIAGEGEAIYRFEAAGEKAYVLSYWDNSDSPIKIVDSMFFQATLVQLGEERFLDLYPLESSAGEMIWQNFIPVHTFVKIERDENGLNLSDFDHERLQTLFQQNRIRLPFEEVEEVTVITASTQELQRFISKYASQKGAFEGDTFLKREY